MIGFFRGLNESTTKPIVARDYEEFNMDLMQRICEAILNGKISVAKGQGTGTVMDLRRKEFVLNIGDIEVSISRMSYSLYGEDERYNQCPEYFSKSEAKHLFCFIDQLYQSKAREEAELARVRAKEEYARRRDSLISTVYALPCPITRIECTQEAAEIFKNRFSVLVEAVKNDDLSHASFPLMGSDARLQLQTQRNTLQWVLEMLNIPEDK